VKLYDMNPLLDYVVNEGLLYTCGGGPLGVAAIGAHYVVDPTGWGVQLDIEDPDATTMPFCQGEQSFGGEGLSHPGPSAWCDLGACRRILSNYTASNEKSGEGKDDVVRDDDILYEIKEGQEEEHEEEAGSYPSYPPFMVIVLVAALGAFAFGFTRGGGTPDALLLGPRPHEYELVNKHAVTITTGGSDDSDDDDDEGDEENEEGMTNRNPDQFKI
jgi:hypothetical protein